MDAIVIAMKRARRLPVLVLARGAVDPNRGTRAEPLGIPLRDSAGLSPDFPALRSPVSLRPAAAGVNVRQQAA